MTNVMLTMPEVVLRDGNVIRPITYSHMKVIMGEMPLNGAMSVFE